MPTFALSSPHSSLTILSATSQQSKGPSESTPPGRSLQRTSLPCLVSNLLVVIILPNSSFTRSLLPKQRISPASTCPECSTWATLSALCHFVILRSNWSKPAHCNSPVAPLRHTCILISRAIYNYEKHILIK